MKNVPSALTPRSDRIFPRDFFPGWSTHRVLFKNNQSDLLTLSERGEMNKGVRVWCFFLVFFNDESYWYFGVRALSHEKKVLVRRPFVVGNPGNLKGKKNETLVSRKNVFLRISSVFLGDSNSFDNHSIHFSSPQAEKCYFK